MQERPELRASAAYLEWMAVVAPLPASTWIVHGHLLTTPVTKTLIRRPYSLHLFLASRFLFSLLL
jgi:hypothetical protein